ncbi:MAG: acyltransferase family protein [Acidobacteria bacterium]|nr:acyltransferase family protein [Acidobacteriota bacterium]MYG74135.1 acyltransferase family protein [Acidobacteriota bacterium]
MPRDGAVAGSPPRPAPARIHSLDALRAVMMLLGLVLHTALSYVPELSSGEWPYQDRRASDGFGWLVSLIHTFRMPAFFAVAGFFASFLVERRGTGAFLRHRLNRIGVPLVGGWVLLFPLTAVAWVFAASRSGVPLAPAPGPDASGFDWMHLWFLYQLLILSAAVALFRSALLRLRPGGAVRLADTARKILARRWAFVVLVGITALTLAPMEAWELETDGTLLPPLRLLSVYGVFFVFGWLEYGRGGSFGHLRDHCLARLGGGLFFHTLYLAVVVPHFGLAPAEAPIAHGAGMVLLAVSMWLFVLGFLGLFRRLLDTPSPGWRYLSDASYWMYLVHLPLTVALPPLLNGWDAPGFIKFGITLGAAFAITLATYHCGVRSTWVGKRLNGRRYPRTFPWPASAQRLT